MLKPQVPPGQKVPCELLGEELFLYQEPDQAPSEYFGHLVETRERHGDEPPILVETAIQHQAVLAGIPAQLVAEGLMCSDDPLNSGFTAAAV